MLGRKKMICRLKDGTEYTVRKAEDYEWDSAMELAYRVFLRFEAKDYGREGTDSFAQFLTNPLLEKMFHSGRYTVFVAVLEGELIGIGSLRNGNHLSLLFVDGDYHRNGVGTEIIKALQDFLLQETEYVTMTVNASPYGVPFYEHLSFESLGDFETLDGITYMPMELYL